MNNTRWEGAEDGVEE